MKRQVCFYDIEVCKNLFLCCVKVGYKGEILTFEISERKNQFLEMITFFLTEDYVFAGYNCMGYDTPIMNLLINGMQSYVGESYLNITTDAYILSGKIIDGEYDTVNRYRFMNFFKQLDLMTLLASKALRVGLKSLQVTMFYKNVREMVVDWNKPIALEDIDEMIYYCHNDVESTTQLGTLLKDQVQLRQDISKKLGIQNLLSKDPVGVGVEVFSRDICRQLRCSASELMQYRDVPYFTSYADLIQPCIKFKSKVFNELLDWYKQSYVTGDDVVITPSGNNSRGNPIVDKTIIYGKLQHTFAQGGIHSINKPAIYTATKGIRIIDIDAESLYPSLSGIYNFGPKGFCEEFCTTIRNFKAERVIAKDIGKNKSGKYTADQVKDAKIEDKTKKLALNSIIGHLRNKYGPYFAPQANAAICINGQLMLGMLIERMEDANFECIMSNTDGITLLVPEERYDEFRNIYSEWEKETGLKMEETEYEKMVIYAVNDYVAYKKGYSEIKDTLKWDHPEDVIEYNYAFIKTTENNNLVDEYIKAKGLFGYYARLGKGLDSLIVSKALIDYYGKGIPVDDTIINGLHIYDYIIFQKVGKQYDVMWNGNKIQHINRFYVSKHAPYLYKAKTVIKTDRKSGITSEQKSLAGIVAGRGIQIFNEYEEKEIPKYKIDYSYYITRARDIVLALEPPQLTLF